MLWKYILVNSNDLSHIGELSQSRDKKLEVLLGKPGSASFTYPMDSEYAELIHPFKTGIKAMRWNRMASLSASRRYGTACGRVMYSLLTRRWTPIAWRSRALAG